MEKASKRLRRAEREALEVEKERYRERLVEHVASPFRDEMLLS